MKKTILFICLSLAIAPSLQGSFNEDSCIGKTNGDNCIFQEASLQQTVGVCMTIEGQLTYCEKKYVTCSGSEFSCFQDFPVCCDESCCVDGMYCNDEGECKNPVNPAAIWVPLLVGMVVIAVGVFICYRKNVLCFKQRKNTAKEEILTIQRNTGVEEYETTYSRDN